jgi:hypothetical protein
MKPLFTWRSALCDSDLPPITRFVGLVLSLHMNERGGSAFPGATRLSEETGLSERTVRLHLGILVGKGWLRQVERGGLRGETRRANLYSATFPELSPESTTPAAAAGVQHDPCSSRHAPLHMTTPTPAGAAPQGVRGRQEDAAASRVTSSSARQASLLEPQPVTDPDHVHKLIDQARAELGVPPRDRT